MRRIIYIEWEGRNYTRESLLADLENVRKTFGEEVPLYSYGFDVGMMVTDATPKQLILYNIYSTRHGEMDKSWADEADEDDFLTDEQYDPYIGESAALLTPGSWAKYDNFHAMVGKWFIDGWIGGE